MDEQEGIKLTPGGMKKLGNLVNIKDDIIADAIRERGGGQGQVNQLRSDYQNTRVGELANLAATGDPDAETAIKILKQARKKHDKYGNQ
ncbi:hypothetical protein A0J48_014260 [Sphaerospermopsis aphanizomenoides BCCUSP55]|uniref:hypothetical protein n=1 Tax=Sphaerospermopsis aphanizomenoides TaxID=459663 RepID=UPI0019044D5E|nr:hypothetical protein [Sphaerospermopsis aphanizomenoides]MBK1988687.1 hypothetical protein [Sphaerospermopsis aphanizomenoides BCCUSP55]